jgi:hypothetical protein
MAFIQIISLPGGNGATCTKYYFKNGPRVNNKKWIAVGEVAEVPDEELATHLASGKVIQVMGPNAAIPAPKRGRPAKVDDEFASVLAAQR